MNKDKINVLLLVDTLKGGGVEEWVNEIVRLADKDKFNLTVGYLIDLRYKNDFSIADVIRRYDCEVVYLGFPKRSLPSNKKALLHSRSKIRSILQYAYLPISLAHLPKLLRLVKRKNIDVIHSLMHYSFVLGAITNMLAKVPMIYQVTESRAQLSEGRPLWIFRAMRMLEPFVKTFFTGLSQEELIKYGKVPPEKIKPIRGAIDVEGAVFIEPDRNPIIPELSLEGAGPILLSVGRFTPEKGHVYAVEVIEKVLQTFPMARLVILGDGWEYEAMRERVKEANLSGSVSLPGFRADLTHFYSAADIYIRTNLVEAGTLSSHRAMAYGIPVVGFRSEAEECITDGENGFLVERGNSTEMAEKVIELAKTPDLRKKLGENARAYVMEHLDIRNAIADYEKEYTEAAG